MNAAVGIVNSLLEDGEGDAARYLSALPAAKLSLKSPTAPGDGITAPLRVVLKRSAHNGEWVTRLENMQSGGEMYGHYFQQDYDAALADFRLRCEKLNVDPDAAEEYVQHPNVSESKYPTMKALKDNRVELEDAERKEVMRRGAVWHHGPKGKPSPAVWKSVIRGKTYYVCNTHRAAQVKPTLKGAIRSFDFIKTTS